ncbi:MAG: dihydroneopterin triphosphate diphosphatase [Betaproteobacteria bacterium]|nr:dihydroneopterin triphosphate diphosphatase [Betaproteobacteria bacterium]
MVRPEPQALWRPEKPEWWQKADAILADLKAGKSVDELLKSLGAKWESTGPVAAGAAVGIVAAPEALRDWRHHTVYEIFAHWRHRYGPGVTHNTEHTFSLSVPAGMAPILAAREHLAHLWLPYAEAAEKCFSPSNREAILRLPAMMILPS